MQRGLGNSRFGTVERRDERTVPLRHDVLAGERMIRLIPITDELFKQDVVLLRQRLDEFAVEEIADIVPVEVEDVVVVAAHAVVVDHEVDERARCV